jgi:VanZ family protein
MNSGRMKIPCIAMRFVAWACCIGIAVGSWTPGLYIIRTGFDKRFEHTAAYLIAGIAVLLAYPLRSPWSMAALLSAYAGVLELGQMYVPGRHATLLDWLASSSGVVCVWLPVFFCRSRTRALNDD